MRAPLWFGTVQFKNGKDHLTLDNPVRFMELLAGMRGKRFELIVRDYNPLHSQAQRGYYRAVVLPCISDASGFTSEEAHQKLKEHFKVESTAKMTKAEFKEYVDGVVRFAAQFYELNIPDPKQVDI